MRVTESKLRSLQKSSLISLSPILPGLPDDVAKCILALVPRSHFPTMSAVNKQWRSFIRSKEFTMVRKLAGLLQEWLYVLTTDSNGTKTHWEVIDSFGNKHHHLPQMPGPVKAGFGVSVLNGNLLLIGGYSIVSGPNSASTDVFQYNSALGSWTQLASLTVARYDFACAEVNGRVYAIGGHGLDGESLCAAEVYDPDADKWAEIEPLRRPRWGGFAFGFGGKLYVMGGRSSFTIGNSRVVDVYHPERRAWGEVKSGCVMVTTHAVLGRKLFCIEWKNQRKVAIFDPDDESWKMVGVPVTGSSSVGFRFGVLGGKLLLFSGGREEEEEGDVTLMYDPNAAPGLEWGTCGIKPSGKCLCSVTIKA